MRPDRTVWCVVTMLVLCVGACAGASGAGSEREFPLQFPLVDHPVYEYLDRLAVAGYIPLPSGTRPLMGFLRHPMRVSGLMVEDREWRRFAGEAKANRRVINAEVEGEEDSAWRRLRHRLHLSGDTGAWLYGSGYHLAVWHYDTVFSAAVQPVYGLEGIDTDDERGMITRFTGGFRVEGGYRRSLRFFVDFRDHSETGNGPYDSRAKLYEDRWASVDLSGLSTTSYNTSESCLQYYGRDLSLAAGRGRHRWGPGRFGSLILDAKMPPFDYVRLDAVLESGRGEHGVHYTFLHGWLESQVVSDTLYEVPGPRLRTLNAQKFLSGQRLEVRARANLLLGFSQVVVYGDRDVQLGYLTPLNFLYSVQHSNDDKDNFMLSFDVAWRPVRGLVLYGESLFDDITVSKLLTPAGVNKTAFTAGAHVLVPRDFWRHFDVKLEYTEIRPFVYSHVFRTNVYTHWTSPIGYSRAPNSRIATGELRGTFYPLQVAVCWSRQDHGDAGGSVDSALHEPLKKLDFPLLSGNRSSTVRAGVQATVELLPNLAVFGQAEHIGSTGREKRLELRGGFAWNL